MAESDKFVEFDPRLRTPAEIEARLGGPERPPQVTANWRPGRAVRPAKGPRTLYAGWDPPVRQQVAIGQNEMVVPGAPGPLIPPDDNPEVTLDSEPPHPPAGDEQPEDEQADQDREPSPPPVDHPPAKPRTKPHRA